MFKGQRGFDNVFYQGTFGSEGLIGLTVTALDQLLTGQYSDALASTERALAISEGPEMPPHLSGAHYLVRGIAACKSELDTVAAEAYSRGLERSPEFASIHMLRADARARLGDDIGAAEDLRATEGDEEVTL